MKFLLITCILLSLITSAFSATWFCKEASSELLGNTFYACGYSKARSLNEARENSLNEAKKEFESFCKDSQNWSAVVELEANQHR